MKGKPMKDRGTLSTQDALLEVCLASNEPKSHVDEYSQSTKILDAKYKPAVLKDVTQMCTNFNTEGKKGLLQLLQNYEHLFDGALVELSMEPISLYLIDKGLKTVHARSYCT